MTQAVRAEGEVTVPRAGMKRAADAETGDSNKGDRIDWRNYTEPGSSSQAPSGPQATGHITPPSEAVDGGAIPGTADRTQGNVGGGERFLEEHVVIEYDGTEIEHKSQRISSIRLGIGSDDISGELNVPDYDEELLEMANEYQAALEVGGVSSAYGPSDLATRT